MRTLHWSSRFRRSFKRTVTLHPGLRRKILDAMHRLAEDPYASELKTHKLKGEFEGTWACSVAYDLRIVFEFTKNSQTRVEKILLIDIGTHEEVY